MSAHSGVLAGQEKIAHTWFAPTLSPDKQQNPFYLAQSIITSYFPNSEHVTTLQAQFTANGGQDAAKILEDITDFIIENEDDPLAALEKIAQYLNLETVESAVKRQTGFETFESGIEEAKKHIIAAERLIETLHPTLPFSVQQTISSILYSIHSVIAGLLGVFGFSDFVKTTQEGPMEGGLKAQKLFILVILFSALATMIMPIAGQLVGAAILGGILFGLIALTAIYPYIAPTPRELSRCKNWTQLIEAGKLPTITGRDAICDSIAAALTSSNEQPLILGKSGAGKTASAQAFAHAVYAGNYQQLAGKSVFYLNAGDLLSSSITGSANILQTIKDQLGKSGDNVIIILDEIHTLFKDPNNPIAQQLKSMLDRTQADSYRYVVGITTEKEYAEHVTPDEAFCRRWKNITLPDPRDEEILTILNYRYLSNHGDAILPRGALEYLYALSSTKARDLILADPGLQSRFPQPLLAIQILDQCLALTSGTQTSELKKQIDAISSRIESLESSKATGNLGKTGRDPEMEAALAALRESAGSRDAVVELRDLLEQKAEKQAELKRMKPLIAERTAYQKVLLQARVHQAMLCTLYGKESSAPMSETTKASYALLTGFLLPRLEAKAIQKAAATSAKIKITPEIITQATDAVIEGILKKAESDKARKAAEGSELTAIDRRLEQLTGLQEATTEGLADTAAALGTLSRGFAELRLTSALTVAQPQRHPQMWEVSTRRLERAGAGIGSSDPLA